MSEPIVFISKHKIKPNDLDAFKLFFVEGMAEVEAEKPGTAFQYGYVNSEWTIVRFVHVFPDADAFDKHLIGADNRADRSSEFLEPISMEIFGTPSEQAMEMFRLIEASGVSLVLWPEVVGGFFRLEVAD